MPDNRSVTVEAHAKVNLMLSVTSRRTDGYHMIDTVMQSVSLANRITVTAQSDGITLECDDALVPIDRRNTAMRAAECFFTAAKICGGAHIRIEKNVPYEAGLGSASADAAGTLAALCALYPGVIPEKTLFAAALSVGADVPFCLSGGTMRARGVGELLTQVSPLPECFFVIARGRAGVSTPQAYRAVDEYGLSPELTAEAMCDALTRGNLTEIGKLCKNIFTECCGNEETSVLLNILSECGAIGASMSGSGSAVFGIFESRRDAERAARKIKPLAQFSAVAEPARSGVEIL